MIYLAWYCFVIMAITLAYSLANDKVNGDIRLWTVIIFFPVALFFGLYIFI